MVVVVVSDYLIPCTLFSWEIEVLKKFKVCVPWIFLAGEATVEPLLMTTPDFKGTPSIKAMLESPKVTFWVKIYPFDKGTFL